ncbi:MAG: T9SS type A sorting domain-containing protein [Saprospiraceae bacterium]
MKNIFALFIILFSIALLQGQKSSDWELVHDKSWLFIAVHEKDNGDIVAITSSTNDTTSILRVNSSGDILQTNYIVNDSFSISFHRIIWIPSKSYYLLLGADFKRNLDTTSTYYFCTAIMDENLNIIKVNYFDDFVEKSIAGIYYEMNSQEQILVSVSLFNYDVNYSPTKSKYLFLVLDNSGQILKFNEDIGGSCNSLIQVRDQYKCVGWTTRLFDQNFNYLGIDENVFRFLSLTNSNKVVKIGEYIYAATVRTVDHFLPDHLTGLNGPILYKLDEEMNILKRSWMDTESKSYFFGGNIFDIAPDSSFYIGDFTSPQNQSLSFSLGKFDLDFNKKWQIKYSALGEYHFYIWGVEATQDNGVIVYGSVTTWYDLVQKAYMIKFNSEGNIVWTHNVPKDAFFVQTYPNPTQGEFTLEIKDFSGHADVRIFDTGGRNVYVQHGITAGKNNIDISSLPVGTYVYKVLKGASVLYSDNIVKVE